MKIENIQSLIDNPLQPNPTEWAMDVKDVLEECGYLSAEAKTAIEKTKFHNGAFPNYSDELIAILKKIIKKWTTNNIQGDTVVMTKNNVFIIYSHQHSDMMREIKDFIREELDFEPKTLDIAECTGSVWDAFSEKSEPCQKAVVLMADDDVVEDENGKNISRQDQMCLLNLDI